MVHDYFVRLRAKGLYYWSRLLVFLVVGILSGYWAGQAGVWIEVRYTLFHMIENLGPRQVRARYTTLVLVGDEEYWKGELDRRVPIKRDYLAKLVTALDSVDAETIALDFDFRSPVPDTRKGDAPEPAEYHDETRRLIRTINAVSLRRHVVLPVTIHNQNGAYQRESDVFDDLDLAPGIKRGYIVLPADHRLMPVSVTLSGKQSIESFALAIAELRDPRVMGEIFGDEAPFAGYIDREKFGPYVPAGELLKSPKDFKNALANKVVIVGADWSSQAYNRGPKVDSFATPAGNLQGAYVHANYVEALLDGRVYKPAAEWLSLAAEIMLVLLLACVFALEERPSYRILEIVPVFVLAVVAAYVAFINFGIFFDFLIPLVAVGAHAGLEQVLDWRKDAHLYRNSLPA